MTSFNDLPYDFAVHVFLRRTKKADRERQIDPAFNTFVLICSIFQNQLVCPNLCRRISLFVVIKAKILQSHALKNNHKSDVNVQIHQPK